MPLAGRTHVVVARQAQLHRLARLPGEQRRDAGDDGRLALLAAEAAAHAAHLHRHRVERNAEHMRDAVLNLGRMLGGREDMDIAAFARGRKRDLAFEIEVILPATAEFAREPMRRRCERSGNIAALHLLDGRNVKLLCHRLLDGENGGKNLVFDLHQLRRGACLVEGYGSDRGDNLPFMLDQACRH